MRGARGAQGQLKSLHSVHYSVPGPSRVRCNARMHDRHMPLTQADLRKVMSLNRLLLVPQHKWT